MPHPNEHKKDWSRVYYSCSVGVPSWVPGLVMTYLNKKAIREATTWVKAASEKQFASDQETGKCTLLRNSSVGQGSAKGRGKGSGLLGCGW